MTGAAPPFRRCSQINDNPAGHAQLNPVPTLSLKGNNLNDFGSSYIGRHTPSACWFFVAYCTNNAFEPMTGTDGAHTCTCDLACLWMEPNSLGVIFEIRAGESLRIGSYRTSIACVKGHLKLNGSSRPEVLSDQQ